jgi:putative acetyltransferase
VLRREQPADHPRVAAVHRRAFVSPDLDHGEPPPEVALVAALREDSGFIPSLSVVALVGGAVVGHAIATSGRIAGRAAAGLGPLGVDPDWQRRGVGTALMHHVIGAADALDLPLVALLGGVDYYARFGFRPASALGVEAPDPTWGDHFQVLRLSDYRGERGLFQYAAPFDALILPPDTDG